MRTKELLKAAHQAAVAAQSLKQAMVANLEARMAFTDACMIGAPKETQIELHGALKRAANEERRAMEAWQAARDAADDEAWRPAFGRLASSS